MPAVSCLGSIGADIINDCAAKPMAGAEQTAYLFNKADITATFDAQNKWLVTDLTVAATKKGYKLTGFRKNLNAGADVVVSDTVPKKWNQFFSFYGWGVEAADVKAIDELDNIVVVYESKSKGVNVAGAFHMLGYDTGLFVSADTKRVNDNDGTRSIEMTNLAGAESPVSEYIVYDTSYATTLALLEGLMTTQV